MPSARSGYAATQAKGGSLPVAEARDPIVLRSVTPSLTMSLETSSPIVSTDGTIAVGVRVQMSAPLRDLQIRFRIRRPNGGLLFQRTEERSDLQPGTKVISFGRSIEGYELRQGQYTVEALADPGVRPAVTLSTHVYVVKPGRKPVTVVLVPRVETVPDFDPGGRFLVDPASATGTRDRLTELSRLVGSEPKMTASLALPPLLLDEWRRIGAGYDTTGAAGSRTVPKDSPLAARYAATTKALAGQVANGRLELADVPFAEPDIAGLQSIGGLADLKAQYSLSSSIYQVSLSATPTSFTEIRGDSVSQAAAAQIVGDGMTGMMLGASSVVTTWTEAPSGLYALRGSSLRALVIDNDVAGLLSERSTDPAEIVDRILSRLASDTVQAQPITVPIALDPRGPDGVSLLGAFVDRAAASGWIRFAKATDAIRMTPLATADLKKRPYPGPPAPSGYWDTVSRARKNAEAFVSAVGDNDPGANSAQYAAFVAESRCWAGSDGRWDGAKDGLGFANASIEGSQRVLSKVAISGQNITLSGNEGQVPLSIRNDSGKILSVTVVVRGANTGFPGGRSFKTTLRPADNFLTLPVVLTNGAVADRLAFTVTAATLPLASTEIEVRASYLDRIVLVATVALVLIGLLFYIRRKVRRTTADT